MQFILAEPSPFVMIFYYLYKFHNAMFSRFWFSTILSILRMTCNMHVDYILAIIEMYKNGLNLPALHICLLMLQATRNTPLESYML